MPARLTALIEARTAQGFSGSVIAARGDTILVQGGYGRLGDYSVGAASRFWIASTAKQFVAVAVLRLAEQRRLSLDDPLSRFFPDAPRDKAAITVRQLLSHMSGIGQSYASENRVDRASAVYAMLAEPLAGPPGSGFRYSNSNIQLAVAIVEIVSGRSYPDFAREVLWRPAALTETGFAGPGASATVSPVNGSVPPRLTQAFWGGEGVFSTAPDLFRWIRALRHGRVLGAAAMREMFAPARGATISEGAAALGWFTGRTTRGSPFIFVRGNEDFGANSLIYVYPDQDVSLIILTHAGNAGERSWSRILLADLEQALGL